MDGPLVMMMIKAIAPHKPSKEIYQTTMTYSLFQGSPKYYRIIDGIRDFEQMPWLATRYAKDMVPSDGVLIWKSGDKAGIYAITVENFHRINTDCNH